MAVGMLSLAADGFRFPPSTVLSFVGFVYFGLGTFIVAVCLRKTKFVHFKNHYDKIVLTVDRAGHDRRNFDLFIEKIVKQIAASQSND